MKDPVALLARLLALSWAGLWMFFFVAESWATNTPLRMAAPWVALGLLFVLLAVVAWRWEVTGGVLLFAVGLLVGVAYAAKPPEHLPLAGRIWTTLFFGVPPALAGVLFLVHHKAVDNLHH